MICFFKTKEIKFRSAITIRVSIAEKLEQRILAEDALSAFLESDQSFDIPIGNRWEVDLQFDEVSMTAYQHIFMYISTYFAKMIHANDNLNLRDIYLANTELLSEDFAHLTPKNFKDLKEALIVSLLFFNESLELCRQPDLYPVWDTFKDEPKLLEQYKLFLAQTKILVTSAKTVSGVIASLGIATNWVYHEPGLTRLGFYCLSELVLVLQSRITAMSAPAQTDEAQLSNMGAAFQFEQVRASFIKKLEIYLESRARIGTTDRSANYLIKTYEPIDRGFFNNERLQDARIEIANNLLTSLQFMSFNGQDIDNPQRLLYVLEKTIAENEWAYRFYGRMVDGRGELAILLDTMRQEFNDMYIVREPGVESEILAP